MLKIFFYHTAVSKDLQSAPGNKASQGFDDEELLRTGRQVNVLTLE